MEDLHKSRYTGGDEVLAGEGSARRRLHDRYRQTIAENVKDVPGLTPGQEVFYRSRSHQGERHIRILKGNLAPGGSVAKITGKEGLHFAGPARVYDREEAMLAVWKTARSRRAMWW